jgi:hypothetical protein
MQRLVSSFLRLSLILSLWAGASAWANGHEEKKEEPPPAPEVEYVKEPGVKGRSGYVYKRVAKPKFEEPTKVPKAPPKEPEKPEPKEEHGGGHGGEEGHGEPQKEEKKEEGHGEPKKEEKKEEGHGGGGEHGGGGGHGGGHGEAKKPEIPPVSAVYERSIIKLNGLNRPAGEPIHTNQYADYFACKKVVNEDYRERILNEINTFADRMELPRARNVPCMIKIAKPGTKFPGAVYIEFYVNDESAVRCIRTGDCPNTRLLMLLPKDKTGKTSKEIYRSYVLTDEKKFRRASFCVSPEGQFLGEKNCYVVLHPDWLFN